MAGGRFTTEEKRKEVEREIGLRRGVYPRMVSTGQLSQADADRQIAIFAELASELRLKEDEEHGQGRLF